MPTQKPRLSITVDPEVFALVQRLSDLGGQSVASIIREILDASRPVLEHMVSAAEAYAAADASKRADILAALEAAESRIMPEAERLQRETIRAFRGESGEK